MTIEEEQRTLQEENRYLREQLARRYQRIQQLEAVMEQMQDQLDRLRHLVKSLQERQSKIATRTSGPILGSVCATAEKLAHEEREDIRWDSQDILDRTGTGPRY